MNESVRRTSTQIRVAWWLLWLWSGTWLHVAAAESSRLVRIDHHMHVHAPEVRAWLPEYCGSPGRTSPCDADFLAPPSLWELIAEMDRAGVRHGVLMSTGYLTQSPFMQPAAANAPNLLRAANDDVVALAQRHPERFSAFIAVNPVTADALPELRRWRGHPGVAGVKLHATNSHLDLRDQGHLAALGAVFAEAARNGWALMIHLRTRSPEYGAQDVRNFMRDVLPNASGVPVQIAHAAGWGGTDESTFRALDAFAAAIEADPEGTQHLYFDLAAVFGDETSAADLQRLAELVRRIGPRHFIAASDWPFALDLVDYYARTYPLLPLSEDEWAQVLGNTYLRRP